MTKWLVKQHYVATENNQNFKGEEKWYYVGKGTQSTPCNSLAINYFINKYGYSTRKRAEKMLSIVEEMGKQEMEYGFWTITSEVVCVEI